MKEELQHQLISCVLTQEKENVFLSSHVLLPECRRSSVVPSGAWSREGYYHNMENCDEKKEDNDVLPMKTSKKDSSMKAASRSLDVLKYLAPQGGWRGLGERHEKKKKISSGARRQRKENEDQRESCQRVNTREGLENERREGAREQQGSEEKKLGRHDEEDESRLGQGETNKEEEDVDRKNLFELHGCVYRYRCSGIPSSSSKEKPVGIHQCCLSSCQEDLHGEKKGQQQGKEEDRCFCPYRYDRSLDEEEVSWVLCTHPGREVQAQETGEKKRKKTKVGDSLVSSAFRGKNQTETGVEGDKEVERPTVQEKTSSSSQGYSSSSLSTCPDSRSTVDKSEKNSLGSSLLATPNKRQRGGSMSSVHTLPRSSPTSSCPPQRCSSLLSTSAVPIPLCPACHSLCVPLCLWFDESIFLPSHLSFDSPTAFQRAFFFLANCDVRTRQQACRSRRIEKSQAKQSQADDGRDVNSKQKDRKDEKEQVQSKLEKELRERSQKHEEGENHRYRETGNVLSVKEMKVAGEQEERGYYAHHDGAVSVTETSEHDNEVKDLCSDHLSLEKCASSSDSLEATDSLFSQREFDFSWNDRQKTVPTLVFLGTSFSTASTDWPLALQREATSALRDALLQREGCAGRAKKDCRKRYRNKEMGGDVYSINVTSCIEASYEVTSDQRELLKNRYAELFSFSRTKRIIEKEEEDGVREERSEGNPGDGEGVKIDRRREKVKDESKRWRDDKKEGHGVEKDGIENGTKARKANEDDWVLGVQLRNETDGVQEPHQMLKNENYGLERIACIYPHLVVKGNARDEKVDEQNKKTGEQETGDSSSSLTDHSFPSFPRLSSNGFSSPCAPSQITSTWPTNSAKEGGGVRLTQEVGKAPPLFLRSHIVGNEISPPACKRNSCESECSPSRERRYITLPSSWVESLPVDYACAGGGCDDSRRKTIIEILPLTHMRRILGDASEVLLSLCPSEMRAWIVQVHSRLRKDFLRLISQGNPSEQQTEEYRKMEKETLCVPLTRLEKPSS